MAASNTDLLRKKKNTFSTNLSGSITDSDTSLSCDSLSGVPTDTAVTITIDRVDANGVSTASLREDITGVVSGNNLTNLVRGESDSTAQAHSDNAVVEITWETETWNDMVDWGLVEHGQDGVLSDRVGADTGILTGTAGTNGNMASWNADGDLVDGPDLLDENDMSSDSATDVATQQSIKAYADSIEKQTNTYYFKATTTTPQTLSNNTNTIMAYGTEVVDPGSDYDNTTYKYTCPVDGAYMFSAGLRMDNLTATKQMRILLYSESASLAINTYANATAGAVDPYISIAYVGYFSAGDDVWVYGWQDSGGNLDTNPSASDSFFSGACIFEVK